MCTSWTSLISPTSHQLRLTTAMRLGLGITKEDAQELAYPHILSPSQQILLSWHHRLYHLPFARLFQLARWKILPRSILGCEAKPPLCVACQFGQAHRRLWRSKTKASGSISAPMKCNLVISIPILMIIGDPFQLHFYVSYEREEK